MSEKKDNCFIDEIEIKRNDKNNANIIKEKTEKVSEEKPVSNRLSNADKFDRYKQNNKMKQKRILNQKNTTSNININLSVIIFLVVFLSSLYIVINKGHIGEYSLLKNNQMIHTAELECDTEFLSLIDKEATSAKLTIDGIKIEDGYELKSSDETIVKIEDGKIVANEKEGTATVTAYYKLYDMNVVTEVRTYIPINEIKVTVNNSTLKVGEDTTLNLKIQPSDGTDEYITYKSSNPEVATVDSTGKVTAIDKGTTVITIKDELTFATNDKTITVK